MEISLLSLVGFGSCLKKKKKKKVLRALGLNEREVKVFPRHIYFLYIYH